MTMTLAATSDRPAEPASHVELKQRSVLVTLVFMIVTLGLYYPIWFLRRRTALNQLDSPRKLRLWPFLIYLGLFSLRVLVAGASSPLPTELAIGPAAALMLSLTQFVAVILMVVQCFVVKDIIEDHLAGPEGSVTTMSTMQRVQLSEVMTFFFGIHYLQYVINRDVVGRAMSVHT